MTNGQCLLLTTEKYLVRFFVQIFAQVKSSEKTTALTVLLSRVQAELHMRHLVERTQIEYYSQER